MGRVASAHSGQRISFLVAAAATAAAFEMFTAKVRTHQVYPAIVAWHHKRWREGDQANALPMFIQPFQDGFLQVAVGNCAEESIDEVEVGLIKERLGVQMSTKEDANRPFHTTFEFTGAAFDTSGTENVRRKPPAHILSSIANDLAWITARRSKLSNRKRELEVVGRAAFCSRFVRFGGTYLNSSYESRSLRYHFCLRSYGLHK